MTRSVRELEDRKTGNAKQTTQQPRRILLPPGRPNNVEVLREAREPTAVIRVKPNPIAASRARDNGVLQVSGRSRRAKGQDAVHVHEQKRSRLASRMALRHIAGMCSDAAATSARVRSRY